MKYKNLLVVAIIVVIGVGMWGVGWVVANPTQPWPSLDVGGRADGELSASVELSAARRTG